jgi:RNA polymerase sigma-70 factor (ECF subfamily)
VGRTNQDSEFEPAKTLGDLLYSHTRAVVPESEWVNLVRSVAAGDQLALQSLYERTHRLVFTLIMRISNDPETAEELTIDVFHDVWRRASTYDPAGGSVIGWIMNQARCRAIDRLRFEQRKKRVNHNGHIPQGAGALPDPQETCHLEEQRRLLRSALDVLTPQERQVIETAFFSELSHQAVAAKLNQPLGTVKARIRSGLEKLRQKLATVGKPR